MKLSKHLAKLAASVIEEIGALSNEGAAGLHKVVSDSEAAIIKATAERNANPEYQKAGEIRSDFTASLNDVKKYQKAKAALALALLDEENLTEEDAESLEKARREAHAARLKNKS